ncbi:hypothetical protein DKAM_0345 [Desulfurococcus amylolyticus 1221n]|uniref:Uncharacterized protein n=1 Tax=Desulfurococcus amylolyticus (strain DSM 18924 / JCM 16383 / VKM B-2413 / 1221n) TaxID=490899 RepID=B8D3J0_DESA1|nr:hypothetical protein DKAM_0345 [Desulfurococcus amylolyticus 1221n]
MRGISDHPECPADERCNPEWMRETSKPPLQDMGEISS